MWEARVSPQLHRQLYGFMPSSFLQQIRGGGYRPVVFLGHGLSVSAWMGMATLISLWLWRTRAASRVSGVPAGWVTAVLAFCLVLTRSITGVLLTAIGAGVLWVVLLTRSTMPVLLLCLLPFGYVMTRAMDAFPTEPLVRAAELVSSARAQSLEFRFNNETILIKRAVERPIFGWGGWGRSRVYDQYGKDISVTDGLWIIAFGQRGVVGVVSLLLVFTLPVMLLARRLPAAAWTMPAYAPAAVAAALLLVTAINMLPNAPSDPITPAIAGGLAALALGLRSQTAPTRPARPSPPPQQASAAA
jgi:hypothetical protein